MKRRVCLVLVMLLVALGHAQANDRDLDNDGQWDRNQGGTDRDLDNDAEWDE